MTQVRLEPAAPRSQVKLSTTEPLRSHRFYCIVETKDTLFMGLKWFVYFKKHHVAMANMMHGLDALNSL